MIGGATLYHGDLDGDDDVDALDFVQLISDPLFFGLPCPD